MILALIKLIFILSLFLDISRGECPNIMNQWQGEGNIFTDCACSKNTISNFDLGNSNYFGTCIKEILPIIPINTQSTLSPLTLWLDGLDITGNNDLINSGTSISSWKDKSANNFSISAGGSNPIYNFVYSIPYYDKYIAFTSSSSFSFNPASLLIDDNNQANFIIFIVFAKTASDNATLMNIGPTNQILVRANSAGQIQFNNSGFEIDSGTGIINLNQKYLLEVEYNNNTALMYLNSVLISNQSNSNTNILSSLRTNVTIGPMTGNIYEIIVYKGLLGDGKRQILEQYLTNKWNI